MTSVPREWGIPIAMMMTGVSLVYLVIAIRRVYKTGWVGAVVKGLLCLMAFYVLILTWQTVTISLALSAALAV